ncbi:MmcQ/YjbR family DNA-binding protein [Klugiella xanthotipulae]|uniref:Putative DNA-binding protein (MmcQ/YjbR family) n=1 Tax=Klugiella xanthotipulae TaxID=244735 RepID=A0A543HH99_9MICO|nr:MmcQ/YjbR family DNA-binding protein [Klugiella xanthotipulae]TQM57708.1 putative DNA-binding protein (MmcQ/YjbR family) [Klugiella xanthotipulae]
MTETRLHSLESIDTLLLSCPSATVGYPFGPDARVYKVGGRMFAILGNGGDGPWPTLTLKGPPVMNDLIRRDFAAIRPGYHMNKRHWNTVALDGEVPDALLEELVAQSYELVYRALTRAQKAALTRPGE